MKTRMKAGMMISSMERDAAQMGGRVLSLRSSFSFCDFLVLAMVESDSSNDFITKHYSLPDPTNASLVSGFEGRIGP